MSKTKTEEQPIALDKRKTRVNAGLLIFLIVALLVVGIGSFALHRFRMRSASDSLFSRSLSQYEKGKKEDAIKLMARFVDTHPGNAEAIAKLAAWLDESATSYQSALRAYRLLGGVLSTPEQNGNFDLRKRVVRLAVKVGRPRDALNLISDFCSKSTSNQESDDEKKDRINFCSDDLEFVMIRGRSHEEIDEFPQAVDEYLHGIHVAEISAESAVSDEKARAERNVDFYVRLISLLDRRGDRARSAFGKIANTLFPKESVDPGAEDVVPPEAPTAESLIEQLLSRMVMRATSKVQGLTARATYRRTHNQLDEAADDIQAALQIDEANTDLLIQGIEVEMARSSAARLRGDGAAYTAHLRAANDFSVRARAVDPDDLRLYLSLSGLTMESGRFDEAEDHLREGMRRLKSIEEVESPLSAKNQDSKYRLTWSLSNTLISESFPATGAVDEKKLAEAGELIDQLEGMKPREPFIDFLRARILMGKREWKAAADKLQAVRGNASDNPEAERIAEMSLARCYERLGLPDERLASLQRVTVADPYWVPARIELANALAAVGQIDEAMANFRMVAQIPTIPTAMARILMQRQLRLPESSRRWDDLEQLVRRVEHAEPRPPEADLLRGELLFYQKKFDAAIEQLESGITRSPDQPAVWAALVGANLRRTDIEPAERIARADAAVERANAAVPHHPEVEFQRIDIAFLKGPEEAVRVLKELEQSAPEYSEADRVVLLRGLSTAWERNRSPADSLRLLQAAADVSPGDLPLEFAVAEQAMRGNDEAAANTALERLRQIEGPGGPNGDFVEAQLLLVRYARTKPSERDKKQLDTARALLTNVGRLRRSWAMVPRAMGLLEGLNGNDAEASNYFERAFEMGDRTRETVSNYFMKLRSEGRTAEILSESARLSAESPSSLTGDVARIATLTAHEARQHQDALKYAQSLNQGPVDYRDLIIEAEILRADPKRINDVEKNLRGAVDAAPGLPPVWSILIDFLLQQKRADDVQELIRDVPGKAPAEPPQLRHLILAVCYEKIGDRIQAEAAYQAAQAAAPGNVDVVNATMIYFLRGNELDKADAEITKILDSKDQADKGLLDAALRTRALISASRGGTYDDVQKAIKMIESNAPKDSPQGTVADLRAMASLLTRSQFRRDRKKLITTLEAIEKQGGLSANERFQLAQLYDAAEDRPAEARAQFTRLLETDSANAAILASAARCYLRGKIVDDESLDQASRYVQQLERLEPRSLRTALIRAALLHAQGRDPDVVPLFRGFIAEMKTYRPEELFRDLVKQQKTVEALSMLTQIAGRKDGEAVRVIVEQVRKLLNGGEEKEALAVLQRYLAISDVVDALQAESLNQVAGTLEAYGQIPAAEDAYRKYVAKAQAYRPDGMLVLAGFLARQKRLDEALDQCRDASQNALSPRVIAVSVGVLRAGSPTPEQIARIEAQAIAALENAKDNEAVALSLSLADLRDLQGKYEETIAIYRSVLDKDSNNMVALNNLAWLLSFMPADRDVCLPLINRAIHLRGPVADLLDTRAVIHMNLNKPREALKDLKEAYEEVANPSILFHLAQAELRSGDVAAARKTYRSAEDAGFNPKTIHPLERSGLDELTKGLSDNRRAQR